MRGDDELATFGHAIVHVPEKGKLAAKRKGRLRLIKQVEPVAPKVPAHRLEERLPVRPLVEACREQLLVCRRHVVKGLGPQEECPFQPAAP